MNNFPDYNTYPNDPLTGPGYAMPQYGRTPDLNLAGRDGIDVASGDRTQAMPDPPKPPIVWPTLSGNPEQGGIDPGNVIPDLNLAGEDGVPTPDVVASPSMPVVGIAPDYGVPDFAVPGLAAGDLTSPGIDQRDEYAADPSLPDLRNFSRPYSLDINAGPNVLTVDPSVNDLLNYDQPNGLVINRDPLMADPMVPDLQHPDLSQQVHMSTRPGDLDKSALNVMDPGTQAIVADKDYPSSQMDVRTNNSNRERHMTLLMDGLCDEECS